MEIDPLVTVIQEIGRRLDMPTPTIDTVLALVRQRAIVAGLYRAITKDIDSATQECGPAAGNGRNDTIMQQRQRQSTAGTAGARP